MRYFRVLSGKHIEGVNEEGKPLVHRVGDVVATDKDLLRFNDPNYPKFEVVSGPAPTKKEEEPEPVDDGLENKTIAQLQDLASEMEVDLGMATKKVEIIAAIREALAVLS